MTNKEIFDIALSQSARDFGCLPTDFTKTENVVVLSAKHEGARAYLPLPFECDLVSYGDNIVAQVSERLRETVSAYINTYPVEHCFETPHMNVLADALLPFGLKICFMAEYFLPDVTKLKPLPCDCELRLLTPPDFAGLYTDDWANALCRERRHLDVLAVGAYDGDHLIGLAGCSADCETMYQIGVDVLPAYRRRGIAAALTSRLATEILALGRVPFYCAAWCNIRSVRNAIKSGFRPAWVELTARDSEFTDKLNMR